MVYSPVALADVFRAGYSNVSWRYDSGGDIGSGPSAFSGRTESGLPVILAVEAVGAVASLCFH